ncbi:allantoate amidohydrolase [Carnimonas nigrificans]|uniref:allantoate amidohydrolase n=1 Tax=Carnimonas nigrificans TaxID=64323 RepID=UPI00046FA5D8|nr:allantoate amidohydrolase [Carnimonas nigrificans]
MKSDAVTVLDRCDQLAKLSCSEEGIERVYLSAEHRACNQLVAEWAQQAELTCWEDAAGNFCTRLEGAEPGLPAVVLGSHLDTVPNAGRYDGILGVMVALCVVERFKCRQQPLPFALEVVGFGDEEGTRFGTALFGSFAFAGHWEPQWWELEDSAGVSLRQAFLDYGLDPAAIQTAARKASDLLGYLEVHIEQGPVLEAEQRALGVVTAIAGARRFQLGVSGQAGHAGTTPYTLRHDALCAASQMVLAVEALAQQGECVATVGQMAVRPGAVNVIPGEATFSIDIRSERDAQRDEVWDSIVARLEHIATERGVTLSIEETHRASAQACSESLQQAIAEGIRRSGDEQPRFLFSGAGHDAMAIGKLTDVGMMFVRCEKGISHHPAEAVTEEDVSIAIDALEHSVLVLAERYAART